MTIEYRGYVINIEPDEYSEPPREWDNLGTMVCFSKRYNLGDDHDFDGVDELEDYVNRDDIISLPLYLFDHSGITMNTHPFSCPWDSRQVGYIFVSKETVREEYGWKNITKSRRQRVEEYLKGEVDTYNMYLTGQVYGYVIEDQHGNHLDFCGGFYGEEQALIKAKDSVDCLAKKDEAVR